MILRSTVPLSVVLSLLVVPATASAQVTQWIAPGDGAFHESGNWSHGVPELGTVALFDLGSSVQVTFGRSAVMDQLLINSGDVMFLAESQFIWLGSAFVWTPSLIVAGEVGRYAALTISAGFMDGGFAIVGEAAESEGLLSLDDGADLTLSGHAWVGLGGAGYLDLMGASALSSAGATLGSLDGAIGEASIVEGSSWKVLANARLGQVLGSQGVMRVDGHGSLWEVFGNLDVGLHGSGALFITDGGEVAVHGSMYAAVLPGGPIDRAEIHVDGTSSRLIVNGDAWLGPSVQQSPTGMKSTMVVRGGARVLVSGVMVPQLFEPIELELTASDNYLEAAALTIGSGSAVVNVILARDFVPDIGDEFRIATLPSVALALPPLPPPRQWEVAAVDGETLIQVTVDADLNGDSTVDVFDLLVLLADWGPCEDASPGACPADLNLDGTVDVLDLLLLLENWG